VLNSDGSEAKVAEDEPEQLELGGLVSPSGAAKR
jgi:hypothetical protein